LRIFPRRWWFFPEAFGTFDEMFEILTLAQTHKLAKKITVILYGPEYWKSVVNWQALVDAGTVSAADFGLFEFADTPEAAFEILKKGLTENYLIPEAEARKEHELMEPTLMPGWSLDDFLGPEIAKTRK
jgi:predicted Rossmann-fold nucleotide-binding protein